MRHDRTVEGTRRVLRHILPIPPAITQIQTQIRKEGKSLTEIMIYPQTTMQPGVGLETQIRLEPQVSFLKKTILTNKETARTLPPAAATKRQ